MTMTLIATSTVGAGGAASIDFTSIPGGGTYTDLYLVVSARSNTIANSNGAILSIKPNNSTTSITARTLGGNGASASSGTETIWYGRINPSDFTASTFGNTSAYIPNYAGSTNKSISIDSVNENNATTGQQTITAGLWSNTSAITSLILAPLAGSFVENSTASLYGITKGSGGATVSP